MRRPDFTACYDEGRRFFTRSFLAFARPHEGDGVPWRVGFAVSKKMGVAVVRNRIKRVLREFFRINQSRMPSAVDIVVVPKRSLQVSSLTLDTASAELLPLLESIRRHITVDASTDTEGGTHGN